MTTWIDTATAKLHAALAHAAAGEPFDWDTLGPDPWPTLIPDDLEDVTGQTFIWPGPVYPEWPEPPGADATFTEIKRYACIQVKAEAYLQTDKADDELPEILRLPPAQAWALAEHVYDVTYGPGPDTSFNPYTPSTRSTWNPYAWAPYRWLNPDRPAEPTWATHWINTLPGSTFELTETRFTPPAPAGSRLRAPADGQDHEGLPDPPRARPRRDHRLRLPPRIQPRWPQPTGRGATLPPWFWTVLVVPGIVIWAVLAWLFYEEYRDWMSRRRKR